MEISISKDELFQLTIHQLENIFFIKPEETESVRQILDSVLLRCERCFSKITCRYYSFEDKVYFSPLHSDQHAVFLYFLSNSLLQVGEKNLAEKVYRLNKMMNGNDIYCSVELPEVFKIEHSIGTIIAPGCKIGNYFKISQNCTLGNNNGHLPVLGEHVYMLSGSKIIGNSNIGDHVIISANTYVKDTDIPSRSIVFPAIRGVVVKPIPEKILNYNNITLFHD